MDCSLPGSSVRGIFQARVLKWIAISFSRKSSRPRDWTHVSCLTGRFFTTEPPGRPLNGINQTQKGKYCMILLSEVPRIVRLIETEVEGWLPGAEWAGMGRGIEGVPSFSFARWKEFCGWMVVMVMWMDLMPLNCRLKNSYNVSFMLCMFYYNKKRNQTTGTWDNISGEIHRQIN